MCFDPEVGAEIAKERPAVVTSVDHVGRLPLRIVVPVTDWKARYAVMPWLVHLSTTSQNNLAKDSAADCFQVKSISLDRFVARIGVLRKGEMDEIAAAIALCVGCN